MAPCRGVVDHLHAEQTRPVDRILDRPLQSFGARITGKLDGQRGVVMRMVGQSGVVMRLNTRSSSYRIVMCCLVSIHYLYVKNSMFSIIKNSSSRG